MTDVLPFPDNLPLNEHVSRLARVLLEEFDGPVKDECAVEMAIRLLRSQRNSADALQGAIADAIARERRKRCGACFGSGTNMAGNPCPMCSR